MIDREADRIRRQKAKNSILKVVNAIAELIKVAAAIGTVVAAFMAWRTLNEMQLERDSAYRPEIVVSPCIFEGGRAVLDEVQDAGRYVYINPEASDPRDCYTKTVTDNGNYLYYEKPYITLMNIGNGTAKDIQVTFPANWFEEVAERLNDVRNGYMYEIKYEKSRGADPIMLRYSDSDGTRIWPLSYTENLSVNITYIKSDDSSVHVALPKGFNEILAVLYGQSFQKYALKNKSGSISAELPIPDLVITVQYLDIQGKPYIQEIPIPWTGHYQYIRPAESPGISQCEDEAVVYLWTGFYEDYIR